MFLVFLSAVAAAARVAVVAGIKLLASQTLSLILHVLLQKEIEIKFSCH